MRSPKTRAAIAARQVSRGADVVFPVAGACSAGALGVAQRDGVWGVGVDVDQDYRPLRRLENRYGQDRAQMRSGASFTGIEGIPNQDLAMWERMGAIADRSKERLGGSDMAVVAFRRQMVDAARAVAKGEPAIGTTPLTVVTV